MKKRVNWPKLLLVLIIVILVIIGIFKFFTKEKNSDDISYAETLQDGTKQNISQKLKESKNIDGIELSNIELIQKSDGTIEFSAKAKNTTSKNIDTNMLQVKLLSKDNQLIGNIYISVINLAPNNTSGIKGSAKGFDISKVYSTEIIKLKSVK